MNATHNESETKSKRLWAAGKVAIASAAGPAGLAIGGAFLFNSARGAAEIFASGGAFSFGQQMTMTTSAWPAIIGAGLIIPAAIAGGALSLSGIIDEKATSPAEAFKKVWESMLLYSVWQGGAIAMASFGAVAANSAAPQGVVGLASLAAAALSVSGQFFAIKNASLATAYALGVDVSEKSSKDLKKSSPSTSSAAKKSCLAEWTPSLLEVKPHEPVKLNPLDEALFFVLDKVDNAKYAMDQKLDKLSSWRKARATATKDMAPPPDPSSKPPTFGG